MRRACLRARKKKKIHQKPDLFLSMGSASSMIPLVVGRWWRASSSGSPRRTAPAHTSLSVYARTYVLPFQRMHTPNGAPSLAGSPDEILIGCSTGRVHLPYNGTLIEAKEESTRTGWQAKKMPPHKLGTGCWRREKKISWRDIRLKQCWYTTTRSGESC